MKVLIAPWGNPANWKELWYEFEGKKNKSSTSLKIIQEVIEPERTIIICLDTLAREGEDYKKVKGYVENEIKEYAKEFGLREYDVLVAPGIGSFPNGIFRGDALDYYYYIIAKISNELLKHLGNSLEIHVDLTHGINYMTILTYKAIREIAETLSIFGSVHFKAYNADPSQPTVADTLSINIIEDVALTPTPFNERIHQGRPIEPINLTPKERERIFKEELRCVREINHSELSAFIGALYNGLPLALYTFFPDTDKLEKLIENTLSVYESHVEVKNNMRLEITRKVKFSKDFKVYVFTYLIAMLLKHLDIIRSRKKDMKIDEIEELKEKLFKFDERLQTRISDDIHTLKIDLKEREVKTWEIYNKIIGKKVGQPDARNFLAHSGFERNLIKVKKNKEEIWLRYDENQVKTIVKLCQRGLK